MNSPSRPFLPSRRQVLVAGAFAGALAMTSPVGALTGLARREPKFRVSLAQWSLHKLFHAGEIDNHRKWLDAAARFGCHSIRVNAASAGSYEEQQKLAADGLRRLTEIAEPYKLNVIVENHGGLSSNGKWLAEVMDMVASPRCGTLPDFGNFCFDWSKAEDPDMWYDRYLGVEELMPYAKAVSAKSHEFDENGDEVRTDYYRMLKVVLDAGYTGWVGVEYEGDKHTPREGCALTKELLEKIANS